MRIMAENNTEFFFYNLIFAAMKTLYYNGEYNFEVLVCPKSVLQWEILFWNHMIFSILNTKLRNSLVVNSSEQQFKQGKSTTRVS